MQEVADEQREHLVDAEHAARRRMPTQRQRPGKGDSDNTLVHLRDERELVLGALVHRHGLHAASLSLDLERLVQ